MKINMNDVYLDRIKQIDIDIKRAISKKQWGIKKNLENEKDRINKCISESSSKEG